MAGVVEVAGGPSPSPSSGEWSRMSINRYNTDPEMWAYWTGLIESGEVTIFVSDGNPATVSIPNQIPEDIAWHWDPEWASAYGMQVVRYDLPDAAIDAVDQVAALPGAGASRTLRRPFRVARGGVPVAG